MVVGLRLITHTKSYIFYGEMNWSGIEKLQSQHNEQIIMFQKDTLTHWRTVFRHILTKSVVREMGIETDFEIKVVEHNLK